MAADAAAWLGLWTYNRMEDSEYEAVLEAQGLPWAVRKLLQAFTAQREFVIDETGTFLFRSKMLTGSWSSLHADEPTTFTILGCKSLLLSLLAVEPPAELASLPLPTATHSLLFAFCLTLCSSPFALHRHGGHSSHMGRGWAEARVHYENYRSRWLFYERVVCNNAHYPRIGGRRACHHHNSSRRPVQNVDAQRYERVALS